MNYCVVTTIQYPTKSIEKIYEKFGNNLIVIGDKKTPEDWKYELTTYLSHIDQRGLEFVSRYYTPDNHYSRKNVGYLLAMKNGATIIYDTDDDNYPKANFKTRSEQVEAHESKAEGWCNVYNVLCPEYIWPRGFSLNHINSYPQFTAKKFRDSSIQQGLADGDPDVDAIWRLVLRKDAKFPGTKSVYLRPNTWCPFNSQSTWWFPKAYALMYLPIYATFRMTDIWRSFVAQRCLWELGQGVTFHSPSEVHQDRNEHNLLDDFRSEVPGYLQNDLFVETLKGLTLQEGGENVCNNLLTCYEAIVEAGILPETEIPSLRAWIKDYENVIRNSKGS